jgi:hypothetical protein
MVAKGYRRFQVGGVAHEELQARLIELDASERDRWAGAEAPPEGAFARAFENANWLAREGDAALAPTAVSVHPRVSGYSFGGPPNRGLRERDPIAPGPGQSVLVASLNGLAGGEFGVSLMAIDAGGRPRTELGASANILAGGRGRRDLTRVFIVPPGRYALSGVNYNTMGSYGPRSFCLRTAYFEVQAGQVLHVGAISVEGTTSRDNDGFAGTRFGSHWSSRLRVDASNLDAARTALASAPALAEALAPAEWHNGAYFRCSAAPSLFFDVGGFEIPGAAP